MEQRELTSSLIVEVCAGNGKLAAHLREKGLNVIATDNYAAPMERDNNVVERLSHRQALRKYNPQVVLGSWLPYRSAVGNQVLAHPSINCFFYIGETDTGCTGFPTRYKRLGFDLQVLDASKFALGTSDNFYLHKGNITLSQLSGVYLFGRVAKVQIT